MKINTTQIQLRGSDNNTFSLSCGSSCLMYVYLNGKQQLESIIMTRTEHEQVIKRLDRKIQRARAAGNKLVSLKEKINAKRQIRKLEQERDNYLINFYKLVAP